MTSRRGCLRQVQDYSRKHFLEIKFMKNSNEDRDIAGFERALDRAGLDWRWHQRENCNVYRFINPLSKLETRWIDGILDVLNAESWEYGEYGQHTIQQQ